MKWFGKIGFTSESENTYGIVTNPVIERQYFGDVLRNHKHNNDTQVNLNFNVSNQISVVADPFANENFHRIAYITFMGAKWRVSSVDVQWPRLIIDLGGVYNEDEEDE